MRRAKHFFEWRKSLNPPTFKEAARVLTERRGAPIRIPQIVNWETLIVSPSMGTKALISQLTGGEVPAGGWHEIVEDGPGRKQRQTTMNREMNNFVDSK